MLSAGGGLYRGRRANQALFTDNGNNDRPLPWTYVTFEMKDLLPLTELQSAIANGDVQRRPEQRRLQVRMAVAIVPSLFVAVVCAWRNEAIEQIG